MIPVATEGKSRPASCQSAIRWSPKSLLSTWLVIAVIIALALIVFVVNRGILAHRQQVSVGREELVGKTAVVEVPLEPRGIVLVEGERWTAISEEGSVGSEEEVFITKVDGLKLWVVKKA